MSENYYDSPNRNHPDIVQSHVDTILVYLSSLLFPKEFIVDPQKAYNRLLISDINAGVNVSLGDAVQYFKQMNNHFPFIAYNVGDPAPADDYGFPSAHTVNGLLYCAELDAYIRAFPMKIELQLVAFYTDSLDANIAMSILAGDSVSLTRVYTPALFDDIEVKLPVDITYLFSKSYLNKEFEQHIGLGRIWDVVFSIELRYMDYIFDELPLVNTDNIKDLAGIYPTQLKVGKVDDLVLRLFKQFGARVGDSILDSETSVPDDLQVVSVSPINGKTGVSRGSEIAVTVNNKVKPETVVSAITIEPYVDFKVYYNVSYTIINIKNNAVSGFSPGTEYTVTIDTSLLDENSKHLAVPYVFSFTII